MRISADSPFNGLTLRDLAKRGMCATEYAMHASTTPPLVVHMHTYALIQPAGALLTAGSGRWALAAWLFAFKTH